MSTLSRRGFLQTASLLVGGATPTRFSEATCRLLRASRRSPRLIPTALFLTWQRDPTTTMTVQWVGERQRRRHPADLVREGRHRRLEEPDLDDA